MSKATININSRELVAYTKKLEKLHRSNLPVAIRQTLNELAFLAKKNELPKVFNKEFINRKKTFVTSSSAFNRSANTFDISKMSSEFGMIKGKSGAADRMHLQELGGKISNREKIAQNSVRTGRNINKRVSKKFNYSQYKNLPKGQISRTKQRTIFKSKKGIFMIKKGGAWSTLYLIDRPVTIKKKPFLMPTAERTAKKTPEIYGKKAEARIKKSMK